MGSGQKRLTVTEASSRLNPMVLKQLISACLFLAVLGCQTHKQSNISVTREITFFMHRYVKLANNGNAAAVAREIYAVPVLGKGFNSTDHDVTVDSEVFEEDFADFLNELNDQGFDLFHVWRLDIRPSGKDMAVVDMDFQWRHSNGTAIGPEHRVATYILIRKPHGWRIVSANGQSFE